MPQTNSFLVQGVEQICNMKYTRKGKVHFMTKDPIWAVKLLHLDTFMGMKVVRDIKVVTDIISENISALFTPL